MEVGPDRRPKLPRAPHQLMDLRRDADTDRVRQADLVGWHGHQPLHDLQHALRGDRAVERAAERDADGDRDRHPVASRAGHEG